MLYNMVFKAALSNRIEFSSQSIIKGLLQHQIEVDVISNARREEMRVHQLKKLEAQAAMSETKVPDAKTISVFSHIFTLKFDTSENREMAFSYLKSIKLKVFYPSPQVVRGKVHGIPYHIYETNPERVTRYLEQYFWYKGGAPSFTITWHKYKALGQELVGESPYFSVFSHEFQYCKQVPQLANPRYKIQLEKFHSSDKKVCLHCVKIGHSYNACPDKQTRNKQNQHVGACTMCASFEHTLSSCPAMNDPQAQCILCHGTQGKGKHTARYCPLYTGTYEKTWLTQTNVTSVWKKNESAVVGPDSQSPPNSQTLVPVVQLQQQLQPQTHQQSPSSQSTREIKQLKDTIAKLQEVIRNQVSKQQQYETLIEEMNKDRKAIKNMFDSLMTMLTQTQPLAANKTIQVIQHDAPTTPVMSSTRSHITASPAAVGNRSRGSSIVNLANQSLITSTIKPVTHTIAQPAIPTHNAFTALMPHKTQAKPATTTQHPTASTDDEKEDDNVNVDMDDDVMATHTNTPKEASSFSLGKKHIRTMEPSPNKKPKKKTKAHSTK
jgi:hypothetical protein